MGNNKTFWSSYAYSRFIFYDDLAPKSSTSGFLMLKIFLCSSTPNVVAQLYGQNLDSFSATLGA